MAKIHIKSEKLTPFGGIFPIMEQFDALLSKTIDSTLGRRCTSYGYQYSEILRSLMCVYLCGGSCVEDVTTHLMKHLSLHPVLRTCSADTILRAIEELTCANTTYTASSGKQYDFNTADTMNELLVTALIRNFYKAILRRLDTGKFSLRISSRVKTFVFKFISVPAKWIKTSRRHVLNIYTDNHAYANLFQTDFG